MRIGGPCWAHLLCLLRWRAQHAVELAEGPVVPRLDAVAVPKLPRLLLVPLVPQLAALLDEQPLHAGRVRHVDVADVVLRVLEVRPALLEVLALAALAGDVRPALAKLDARELGLVPEAEAIRVVGHDRARQQLVLGKVLAAAGLQRAAQHGACARRLVLPAPEVYERAEGGDQLQAIGVPPAEYAQIQEILEKILTKYSTIRAESSILAEYRKKHENTYRILYEYMLAARQHVRSQRQQDPLATVQLVLAVPVQHELVGPAHSKLAHPLDLRLACAAEIQYKYIKYMKKYKVNTLKHLYLMYSYVLYLYLGCMHHMAWIAGAHP